MTDELVTLIELFCEHGGKFENMTIGYRQECGYNCTVIDSQKDATVFCPANLLVDVDDISINEAGLYIDKPENYTADIKFLEKYFAFHFDEKLVNKLLEEKRQIESLSEHEKLLLKKVNLPNVIDGLDDKLEYVKYRIFQSYQMGFEATGRKVIMPVVSFLNHDRDGTAFDVNKNGVSVSGKFEGEVLAHYHMGDTLMFLRSYGFVTDTMFIYSLPMRVMFPNGTSLQIDNNISKFRRIDGNFRWPIVKNIGGVVTVSWFPMYFKKDLWYPSIFAESLSREFNLPVGDILYSVFRYNLNKLLPIVFSLKDSENLYVRTVVSGIERQLELIGGSE